MKSIKARFDEARYEYPRYSDYMAFAEAIYRQGFERRSVAFWFGKLVCKDDYQKCMCRKLISELCRLNEKALRTARNETDLPYKRFLVPIKQITCSHVLARKGTK